MFMASPVLACAALYCKPKESEGEGGELSAHHFVSCIFFCLLATALCVRVEIFECGCLAL